MNNLDLNDVRIFVAVAQEGTLTAAARELQLPTSTVSRSLTRLTDFYGTKFGFVATDTCPQTARYACASCFFSGRQQYHSRTVAELELFGGCHLCGEEAVLWVKVPEEH